MQPRPGKRGLIKTQAMRLFVEQGIAAVSVRDIAAACDMKPSNLYAHFESKNDVAAELFADGYAEYGAILGAIASDPEPFKPRLERMIAAICRLHDEDTIRFRFLIMTQHGFLATVARDERNPVEIMVRTIADAMRHGDIPDREPDLMAMMLIGVIVQPATAHLYGRLQGGLLSRLDTVIAACWRVLT